MIDFMNRRQAARVMGIILLTGSTFAAAAWSASGPVSKPLRSEVFGVSAPGKPTDFRTGAPAVSGEAGSMFKPGRVAATSARAASPAAVQAGTVANTAVCAAIFDQSPPCMVPDGAGGAFVCWHDYRSGELDIYAQRLDPQGVPLWSSDGVPVCKATGFQWYPRIVADGSGGAIVTWSDGRADSTGDVFAQRLTPQGAPVWAIDGIAICTEAGAQSYPVPVADGVGGAVVVWSDRRGADLDLYAQRINANGATQWTAGGVVVCGAGGDQESASVVADFSGGALVAWLDHRAGSSEIYAQRVTGGGSAAWTANGVAVCTSLGVCESPVTAADGAGGVIASWADGRGADFDLYAQRLNATGGPQWTANGVLVCGATGNQRFPALCQDGAGGGFLTWQDQRGADADIYARRIDAAGVPQWAADGVAICSSATDQTTPAIQSDPSGGAVIAWSDGRTPADGLNIYGQHVNTAGAVQWTANGVLLSDGTANQELPRVVANGLGGAVASWRDWRAGVTADIYSQRVDAAGSVLGPCPTTTIALAPSIVVTATASPAYYDFPQGEFYWAAVGVRGPAGTDWDLEVYEPNTISAGPYPVCFADPVAASYSSSKVDLILGNFNIGMTWPDDYGMRASRYSGTGDGSVEWDDDIEIMTRDCGTGGACGAKSGNNWTGVVDVWDLFLFSGQTYTFDLTLSNGSSDIKMLLFRPGAGGTYFVPRSAAEFETKDRFTVYQAPVQGYYGVVFVNDNGVAGTYTARVNTGLSVGVGGDPSPAVTGIRSLLPNPSRGQVEIQYALTRAGTVGFQVFDMAGRSVSEIAPHRREAGTWSIKWNGRGANGQALATGVYFVQMKVDGTRFGMSRLVLVR